MSQHNKTGFWNTLKWASGMAGIHAGTRKEETICRIAVSAGYAWAMKTEANRTAILGLVQVRDICKVPDLLDRIFQTVGIVSPEMMGSIVKHLFRAVTMGAEAYIQDSKQQNKTLRDAIGKAVEHLTLPGSV